MRLQRRDLLTGSAAAVAFAGLASSVRAQTAAAEETYVNEVHGYGPLVRDPNRLLDLPEGFTYQVISQSGDTMDDGLFVPGQPDGMGCFDLGDGKVALVRNHELKGSSALHRNMGPGGFHQERIGLLDPSKGYDTYKDGRALPGGVTTLVYDLESRRTVGQHLSLAGTSTNCCGGHTPWGSWLTCEETEETPAADDVTKPHGYVFEVPATTTGLVDPVPLKAMGRFDHEAVCIDPRTGIVYLTEDKNDGLFYRFIPTTPGKLIEGGRLQAMAFKGKPGADSTNQEAREWAVGDWREVVWIDMEDVESPNGDLRQRGHAAGAALVARGEGVFWGDGELYMTATSGGPLRRGQVLRYVPSRDEGRRGEARRPGRMQLFVESADIRTVNMADNITIAPWGHLILCEDNYSEDVRNHLKGVTPEGKVYVIGRNVFTGNSEFAGAVFSPDGEVLFVNIMYPGITLAIVLVLAVKPQRLRRVLEELKGSIHQDQLVVSIVAGAKIETIADELLHAAVVRTMPNTPAQIGEGVTAWTPSAGVNEKQESQVCAMLNALGKTVRVENERQIDMATALSATGPTYIFLVMEALIDAGVHMGFSRHVAQELVHQMMLGAVMFARESHKHPAELRNMVTSPGGTSAEAIYQMEKGSLRTVLSKAVWAAYQRAESLGEKKK